MVKIILEIVDDCKFCPAFAEHDYGEYHCNLMSELEIFYGEGNPYSPKASRFPIPENCPLKEDIRVRGIESGGCIKGRIEE